MPPIIHRHHPAQSSTLYLQHRPQHPVLPDSPCTLPIRSSTCTTPLLAAPPRHLFQHPHDDPLNPAPPQPTRIVENQSSTPHPARRSHSQPQKSHPQCRVCISSDQHLTSASTPRSSPRCRPAKTLHCLQKERSSSPALHPPSSPSLHHLIPGEPEAPEPSRLQLGDEALPEAAWRR